MEKKLVGERSHPQGLSKQPTVKPPRDAQVVPPTQKGFDKIKQSGSTIEIEDRSGVTLILQCEGEQHANIIAKALSDGLAHFDTRCD